MSPVIIPVRQRTLEWIEAREHGIGASQAAAAIGMSPWQSTVSLWAEKLGLTPPQAETLPMRIGTELEPLIARLYTEATGVKIRRAVMLRQHPEHTWMLASLDRRAGRKPVELKYSARGDGYGEPGTDEVPDDVLTQVLHQLAVVDEPEADIAALIGERREVQIYRIRREAEAEARIIEREAIFWHHVETRTEPPLDSSESTRQTLLAMYPRDNGELLEPTAESILLVARLAGARADKKAAEAEETEVGIVLRALIGEASGIVGLLAAKKNKDGTRTNWPAIAAAYRELLEGKVPTDDLDAIASIHQETTLGARPLRLLSKGAKE